MTQTFSQYYAHDHERLDDLFKEYQSLKNDAGPGARARFREFKADLERHIAWEEDLLFPVFEEKTGMRTVGPTAVMRLEHEEIRRCLISLDETLTSGRRTSTEEDDRLLAVLAAHNVKEEAILYPMIDRQVTPDEREQVFKSMAGS